LKFLRDIRAYKTSFYLLLFLLLAVTVQAQNNTKQDLVENIEQITKIIDAKNQEVSSIIKNYTLLESKIKQRNALVGFYKNEKRQMGRTIDSLSAHVKDINNSLGELRKEYGSLLKINYLHSLTEQRWAYILSSSTLLEGYKKWIFSKQYKDLLKGQEEALYQKLELLNVSMTSMQGKMSEKESIIQAENVQAQQIEREETEKDGLLSTLKKKENEVKEIVQKDKEQKKELRKEIETVIIAEGSRKSNLKDPGVNFNDRLTTASKGSLLWPVKNAIVTGHYGKHPHPSLKHVEILNNGIDLDGGENKEVRLVFDGEVVGRKKLADKGIMIIVKHGNYYSVYSQIVVANVRAGDKVVQGTIIGSVQDELHFEIWQGKEKLNPIHWLLK